MRRFRSTWQRLVISLVLMSLSLGFLAVGSALAAGDVNETSCPNESMVGFSANLPDCRAYEQVSPAEKDNGSGGVLYFGAPEQEQPHGENYPAAPERSLADGSEMTYLSEPVFHLREIGKNEEKVFAQYTSRRLADGWETMNGDLLAQEEVPDPVLPSAAATSTQFVEDAVVVEETPSGSKVFFLDTANTSISEPDLYEYDVVTGRLTDLTVDTNPGERADARGIIGIGGEGAEEGAYVYFVAGGDLAARAHAGDECKSENTDIGAIGEGCNLYLRHNGVTTFIATLAALDEGGLNNNAEVNDWPQSPLRRTAEVSPNGRYLAFSSHAGLTGQDPGMAEIFRYDAQASEVHQSALVCVSCSPAGSATPTVIPADGRRGLVAINGANRQRYILNDGRVFFTTEAQLVPQDVNRQDDVYEWEAGAPLLISGGTSEFAASRFTDASESGSDVFFTTAQSLVPQDGDEITDLYDAREDGGFPAPLPPGCALGAACPAALAPPPSSLGGTPASATFSGVESTPASQAITRPLGKRAPVTKAEKLAKALKSCHAKHNRKKRASCEATARKRYKPPPKRRKRGKQ